ncbi:MAG: hypothetical protein AAGC78_07480 [Cellvibrio sp.]|uniref:hypothetical protein n=1 Tax=Cellvibrio sp. TaxID=1965322 RepID=UPI0031AAB764
MSLHTPTPTETPPAAEKLQEDLFENNPAAENAAGKNPSWSDDMQQTLKLGDQFVTFLGGIVDLARMEALLAIRTFPKVLMLWLLMMPVILLTWVSFSVFTGWGVYALTGELGWGIFTVFAQQLLLLLVCRWLFIKYRARMSLPNTRVQVDNFVRSVQHGFGHQSKTKE